MRIESRRYSMRVRNMLTRGCVNLERKLASAVARFSAGLVASCERLDRRLGHHVGLTCGFVV